MNRIRTTVVISLLVATTFVTGCSSIPSNTPTLLDRTTERIETRSEVVYRVLRTAYDETGFSRQDVEAARRSLEGIATNNMSPADKKAVEDAIKSLKSVESNLGKIGAKAQFPDDTKRVFTEIIASLKLVRQVIGTEIDKKALVQEMIDIAEKTKEKPQ
jgi:hypothetical protein